MKTCNTLTYIVLFTFAFILCAFGIKHGLEDPELGLALWTDESHVLRWSMNIGQGYIGPPKGYAIPYLFYYLSFVIIAVRFVIGLLTGRYETLGDLRYEFFTDPSALYLTGRYISVFFVALSVVIVFFVASKITDKRMALLAALLFLFNGVTQKYSVIFRLESFLQFLVILNLLSCYLILNQDTYKVQFRKWIYVFAGIIAGCTLGAKYHGAFVIIPVVLSHLFYRKNIRAIFSKEVVAIMVLYMATFFGINFFLLNGNLLNNFAYGALTKGSAIDVRQSSSETGKLHSWGDYFTSVLPDNLGTIVFAVFLAAALYYLIRILRSKSFRAQLQLITVALVYIISYYLIVGYFNRSWDRDIMAIFPFVFIVISALLYDLYHLEFGSRTRTKSVLLYVIMLMVLFPFVIDTFEFRKSLMDTDPRLLANQWFQSHASDKDRVYQNSEMHGVPLPWDESVYRDYYTKTQGENMRLLMELAGQDSTRKRFLSESEYTKAKYLVHTSRRGAKFDLNRYTLISKFESVNSYIPSIYIFLNDTSSTRN